MKKVILLILFAMMLVCVVVALATAPTAGSHSQYGDQGGVRSAAISEAIGPGGVVDQSKLEKLQAANGASFNAVGENMSNAIAKDQKKLSEEKALGDKEVSGEKHSPHEGSTSAEGSEYKCTACDPLENCGFDICPLDICECYLCTTESRTSQCKCGSEIGCGNGVCCFEGCAMTK